MSAPPFASREHTWNGAAKTKLAKMFRDAERWINKGEEKGGRNSLIEAEW